MDMCSANIHGSETTMDQADIDNLIGAVPQQSASKQSASGGSQADIDALFD
jgi:hypothetical protein